MASSSKILAQSDARVFKWGNEISHLALIAQHVMRSDQSRPEAVVENEICSEHQLFRAVNTAFRVASVAYIQNIESLSTAEL